MRAGLIFAAAVAAVACVSMSPASAQENYDAWPPHVSEFESTGGGGIVIRGYNPVIMGDKCATNFTATEPNGTVYSNAVEFDAIAVQGGTLCTNGRWRALDGSAAGTTPYRIFFKNGVSKRSP